ncbi:hypothetical protein Pla52n_58870 [Stieleria varia]|uniref:Uncharacterized protein n=1 Tax=Stieleria varia TaxID=2528005 RepID=A0A5C6A1N2_9BACT|nr:hypothetical protein Pla52n_58870 [Stieleria varia]
MSWMASQASRSAVMRSDQAICQSKKRRRPLGAKRSQYRHHQLSNQLFDMIA